MPIIQSIQQLEALRHDWNLLADASAHALLRHEWVMSAARTLYAPQLLTVLVRMQGGQLTAAAPLARRAISGIERLEFLGSSTLHEPCGFLAPEPAARRELIEEVIGTRKGLVLQRMVASEEVSGLAKAAAGRGLVYVKPAAPSLRVQLPADRSEFVERLPGKLRYDIRRARTRAEQIGAVRIEVLSPTPAESPNLFERFMEVEASGWKGRAGSALKVNPRLQAFYRTYCSLASESGILRMFFLRVGESLAAAQIAVEVYDRLWILKIGYDERLARCSPGFLLTAESIAYAAREGLSGYEFLGAPEAWESRWRPDTLATTLVVFYPRNVSGGAAAVVDFAGTAWRRVQPRTSI
jgi:CelD/BcsL family acetyltransferase involved in cellulose biosynthesis